MAEHTTQAVLRVLPETDFEQFEHLLHTYSCATARAVTTAGGNLAVYREALEEESRSRRALLDWVAARVRWQ